MAKQRNLPRLRVRQTWSSFEISYLPGKKDIILFGSHGGGPAQIIFHRLHAPLGYLTWMGVRLW